MATPPCICGALFDEWCREGIDRETFLIEEEQRFLYGHYASCNHETPEPVGILHASSAVLHIGDRRVMVVAEVAQPPHSSIKPIVWRQFTMSGRIVPPASL